MNGIKIAQKSWDGILFPVPGRKDKVMIVVSGSDGGLEHTGKNAKFLSDNSIPALAFSLFKTKHSPKALSEIPLEQIRNAITFLRKRGYQKIGVQGVSKGAEYVLADGVLRLRDTIFFQIGKTIPAGMCRGKEANGGGDNQVD